jgi:hypothetical protein
MALLYHLSLLTILLSSFNGFAAAANRTALDFPTGDGFAAITGVQTGIDSVTGARPARQNIDDLMKDDPTWYVGFRERDWHIVGILTVDA